MGWPISKRKPLFTKAECEYIKANYPKTSIKDIANHLGKSHAQVMGKVWRMHLMKSRPHKVYNGWSRYNK